MLLDPTLDIYDSNGQAIATNDDWRDTQELPIDSAGLAPGNDREAAVMQAFIPGAYTAIVRGKNGTTGNALVEAYHIQ